MEYFQIICPAQKKYRFKETYLQNHIFRGLSVCFFPSVLKAVPTRSNIFGCVQIHMANTFSGSPICFSNFSWGIFWLGKSLTQKIAVRKKMAGNPPRFRSDKLPPGLVQGL